MLRSRMEKLKEARRNLEGRDMKKLIATLANANSPRKRQIIQDALWVSLFMTDRELDDLEEYLKNSGKYESARPL